MDSDSLIYLDNIKTSFYEKGVDLVNVHLYVREVDDNEILFEDNKVICKFSTKFPRFIKQYAGGGRGSHSFCYTINTREAIIPSGCYYSVKGPFIEIILKKKVPQKWKSLQNLELIASGEHADGKKKLKSPKNSQLLGGKSTPKKANDEKKQENGATNMENVASSSKTEDARNIKKAVISQPEYLAGLTGLENYANNCYMNVVIQILANIEETRDYFKNDHYLKDINATNPLSSGGKVAKAFADVTKALWSFRKNAFKPAALKNIMGKRYSLFLGWQQHDAQEFFASLLDNLHEDLNQAHWEKGAEKDSNKTELDTTVNEKPDTAWSSHLKRNNSVIVKLFHGQLMSKLTCAFCHKVSCSYDPCAQISLPILSTKQLLKILFFSRDVNKPPLLVPMQISTPNAKVWHLVNMLQTQVKVPARLISLFTGISNICTDEQAPLLSVRKYKYVIASEISSKDETEFISIPVFQYLLHIGNFVQCDNCFVPQGSTVKLKRCTRCYAVAYCTRECQTNHWQAHSKSCYKELKMHVGVPFYLTLRKDSLTFETLEEALKDRAKFSVELFSTPILDEKPKNDNSASVEIADSDKKAQRASLISSAVCVIKTSNKPIIDDTCTILNNENFSADLIFKTPFLILEWQNKAGEENDIANNIRTKVIPTHEVFECDTNTGMTEEEDQCSVYDCLRLFMEPESLDERDSWKCPKCKNLQSAKKEMAISSPQGLLLLHLKRFTYGDFGQKINKAVSYPLSGFDLTPFVAKETRSKMEHPLIYDLCGVITHSGSMRMGHYTCMVRMLGEQDQEEEGWRYFDDDSVINIKSDKVISPNAYVLVYRIRGGNENLIKRRRADVVAAGAFTTVEKAHNSADRLSGCEFDTNSMKRSSSSDSNSDENISEAHKLFSLNQLKAEHEKTFTACASSFQPINIPDSLPVIPDSLPVKPDALLGIPSSIPLPVKPDPVLDIPCSLPDMPDSLALLGIPSSIPLPVKPDPLLDIPCSLPDIPDSILVKPDYPPDIPPSLLDKADSLPDKLDDSTEANTGTADVNVDSAFVSFPTEHFKAVGGVATPGVKEDTTTTSTETDYRYFEDNGACSDRNVDSHSYPTTAEYREYGRSGMTPDEDLDSSLHHPSAEYRDSKCSKTPDENIDATWSSEVVDYLDTDHSGTPSSENTGPTSSPLPTVGLDCDNAERSGQMYSDNHMTRQACIDEFHILNTSQLSEVSLDDVQWTDSSLYLEEEEEVQYFQSTCGSENSENVIADESTESMEREACTDEFHKSNTSQMSEVSSDDIQWSDSSLYLEEEEEEKYFQSTCGSENSENVKTVESTKSRFVNIVKDVVDINEDDLD